jgi:alkylation response protein AidB-like acyl-CoA dehydrogenase
VGAGDVAHEASESGQPWDALVAKALAGKAAEAACTQAQQCFGAIGFTWEHPFPHRLRRVYLLDRLFGDWRSLETEIGSALLSSRSVRRVGAL